MTAIGAGRRIYQGFQRRFAVRGAVALAADVHIGPGTRLWAPQRLTIAEDVYIGKYCTIEVNGYIGPGTLIANQVGIVGRHDHAHRTIGTNVRRSPWVGDEGRPPGDAVLIHGDCWIGFGAIILAPCEIQRGAIIAAGAVVTSNVSRYAVVAGNPAKQIAERFTAAEALAHERGLARARTAQPACPEGRK